MGGRVRGGAGSRGGVGRRSLRKWKRQQRNDRRQGKRTRRGRWWAVIKRELRVIAMEMKISKN